MSSRVSNAERRTNGSNDNANPSANSRPRMTSGHSFKTDRNDPRGVPSPQPGFTGTGHKRTASGNTRPVSRATEDRRTERVTVTTREKLVSRTRSPERRTRDSAPPEKWKGKDVVKPRPAEAKQKEPQVEAPSSTSNPL
jgi:gamma-tubulin complex component 2